MVQRYIDSRDSEGRTIGIRVDIARLPGGGWGLIRMVGHVSLNGRLVSNASRGAAKMPIQRLLAARARPAEALEAEALALAVGVAEALNPEGNDVSNYEYGVDIAIDPEDRLWFIEANPSPQTIWAEHQRAVLVIAYLKSLVSARAPRYGEMAG
jgi:glutathione synthase/RimK-type ligase-like ATP-grasp enzyme